MEHPPLAETNRTHSPPFYDTSNAQSLRRAEEPKGQAEDGRHPGSGRQRADQWEAEERETHAGHTGRWEQAANQKREMRMERKDKRGKGEPQKTKGHPHPTLAQPPNPGKKKEEQGARRKREQQKRKRSEVERKKPAAEQGGRSQAAELLRKEEDQVEPGKKQGRSQQAPEAPRKRTGE